MLNKNLEGNLENKKNSELLSNISYFSIFTENVDKLEKLNLTDEIFGDNGVLNKIFDLKHKIFGNGKKLVIEGLDNIKFEFEKSNLTTNSGVLLINFEVKNLSNNLTKKQKYYLKTVFYSLKKYGFNFKYIDDNFSGLDEKDYFIGHKCNAGDICSLITSFKDNFKNDEVKIKENLNLLKKGEGNFEELKKEIISKEVSNILNFKLSLEHIIRTRNNLLKRENKNIDDLILQEALENSFLNNLKTDKLFQLEKKLTDNVLIGSIKILLMLIGKLDELLKIFEQVEQIKDKNQQVELIEKIIKTSNNIFFNAELTAKKNGILEILNPKNWFNKSTKIVEKIELTSEKEIDDFINFALKFFVEKNYYSSRKSGVDFERKLKEFLKQTKKSYIGNEFIESSFLNYRGDYCLSTRKNNSKLESVKEYIMKDDLELFSKFTKQYLYLDSIEIEDLVEFFDLLHFRNYNDLEEIFSKYEKFLNALYFKNYAFEKSKYTNNYQKILYRTGEFYFDENLFYEDYEKLVKEFFLKVRRKFHDNQENKENSWEKLKLEIIEKNNVIQKDFSDINNILDLKIGNNIFHIYIIRPLFEKNNFNIRKYNQIVTIGTDFDNDIKVLKELINTSNEVNRENLQKVISQRINKILLMNFDKNDGNYRNKLEVANYLNNSKSSLKNNKDFFIESISSNGIKFSQKFDLEKGIFEIIKGDIDFDEVSFNKKFGKYINNIKKENLYKYISEVGVKKEDFLDFWSLFKLTRENMYDFNLLRAIDLEDNIFNNYFAGKVLNKYIVEHLVYGKESLEYDIDQKTYIIKDIDSLGRFGEQSSNWQYLDYLEWLKREYAINCVNRKI